MENGYQINILRWEMGNKWIYQDGKWVSNKNIKMGNGYQINILRWEMGIK